MNKLLDEYNSYHHSIGKKLSDADYSALTKETETILQLVTLKLVIESGLLSMKMFLKVTPIVGQEKNCSWLCDEI